MFPRNFWYVAAWDWEVRRQELLARTICNEPIVFWRGEDGKAVALEDRCCHRHMPLSHGKLRGNDVECRYHGLVYDGSGACTHIPSQKAIPPSARVRSYPLVERYHWLWIWLGDPAQADPGLIEDFHWMDDPAWRARGERLDLKGNYLLIVENLLDLTHLQFVHPTTLGTQAIAGNPIKTERSDSSVRVTRWMLDHPAPPFFQKAGRLRADQHVDRWQIIDYSPPAFVRLDVGCARTGTGAPEGNRSEGISMRNLNAITPETETTTHYFWAQAHNFAIDDPSVTELIFRQVHTAFMEDLAVIEAQQNTMSAFGDRLPEPVDLNQDAGGIQAGRIVANILAAENAQPAARRVV
ncbi:MAG TPA: aromatic ring-hydroxylating dioxygenase subunit alpha [Stellaceae bacterium]|jgi:vanillate O-demethylase monooxygenase subunit|nr:aromatic ring-hydroxylating dioxygenase subunit alpha [Stellaceae bacterium]